MYKKTLMVLLFVFWAVPAFAQETLWSRTYGGIHNDCGRSVQQTADGGYIVAGYTHSFGGGGPDVYLIKTNSTGDTLWTRTYGGSNSDAGFSVQQTTDGGYIVAGKTNSFGAGSDDVYLIKTDANGDIVWNRTYGGGSWDKGFSVQQTTDGGYIVAGWTWSFGEGECDVYLIKTNSTGDTLWTRTYGGSDYDRGYCVQQTTDGGYIVAGYTRSFGEGGRDVYLIKTYPNGDIVWTRTYGWSGNDEGYSVQQIPGGYIVAGLTNSFGEDCDVFLIKTNSVGSTIWSNIYGGSDSDYGYSVQQTTDGGYIVAGYTRSFGAGSDDVYLIKTNSGGYTQWTRSYGGSYEDWGWSVQQTTDGGYIVAGFAEYFGAYDEDVMLTKLDSLGNTCIGEFVQSTREPVPFPGSSAATEVTSPPTIVTSPATIVTSPPTEVDTVCWWVCGDVTGDGVIDIGDVVYLINYLYKNGPAPDPLEVGDVNACDAVVDLGDVVYLINYLFRNGPPPYCCPAW